MRHEFRFRDVHDISVRPIRRYINESTYRSAGSFFFLVIVVVFNYPIVMRNPPLHLKSFRRWMSFHSKRTVFARWRGCFSANTRQENIEDKRTSDSAVINRCHLLSHFFSGLSLSLSLVISFFPFISFPSSLSSLFSSFISSSSLFKILVLYFSLFLSSYLSFLPDLLFFLQFSLSLSLSLLSFFL